MKESQLILAFPIKSSAIVSISYFFYYTVVLNYIFIKMGDLLHSATIVRKVCEST